jgi:hypothetical protein
MLGDLMSSVSIEVKVLETTKELQKIAKQVANCRKDRRYR